MPTPRTKPAVAPTASASASPAPPIASQPWQVRQLKGRTPLALVQPSGSQDIRSISLFCSIGRPVLAMVLDKPPSSGTASLSWGFSGNYITVAMRKGNAAGTFWIGGLGKSDLPGQLTRQTGLAALTVNGRDEGEVSLAQAKVSVETALASCHQF